MTNLDEAIYAVTDWFPPSTEPVHAGVYQVDDFDGTGEWFGYWDGKRFSYRALSVKDAELFRDSSTICPRLTTWRGLTSEGGE